MARIASVVGGAATVLVLLAAGPALAGERDAAGGYRLFGGMAAPASDTPEPVILNGQLALGGLSGGVGNAHGAFCCTGGDGFVVFGEPRRQGSDANIAFRAARDTAFANPFSGLGSDRGFRFRASRIQGGRR